MAKTSSSTKSVKSSLVNERVFGLGVGLLLGASLQANIEGKVADTILVAAAVAIVVMSLFWQVMLNRKG